MAKLGPMVLKPEQASESPGGPVKTDRRPHPYSFWFSGPWVGPENWPNRFPGSADSADSGALRNTALDLSLLTQHQWQTLQQALALTPSTPLAHNGTVLVYSVSTTPWWLGQPCHKANPRGPTTPWSREWFKVTMDAFLTHEKGFCNLPLHVQVRGRKASKPAVLQPWGELGSTQQQNRQVGRTWRLVLTLTLLSKPTQNHQPPGFLWGDIMHSLLFEQVESGLSITWSWQYLITKQSKLTGLHIRLRTKGSLSAHSTMACGPQEILK